MQIDAFQIALKEFNTEFDIPMNLADRVDKQYEETVEFCAAVNHGSDSERREEALDTLICGFQNCLAMNIPNPLFAAYLKLQKNAAKYRESLC